MTVWIQNPFDNLPCEGYRKQRYWMMSEAFAAAGHRVVLWTSDFSHATKKRRAVDGDKLSGTFEVRLIPTLPYPKNVCWTRVRSHRNYARTWHDLALEEVRSGRLPRPDVVIASMPTISGAQAALELGHAFGAKTVVDVMDAWPETFERLAPRGFRWVARLLLTPLRRAAQRIYREADLVTGVCERYRELTGRSDYCLAYHGIELEAPVSRAEWPSGNRAVRLVYAGCLGRTYDLDTVLKAVAANSDFTLDIAGKWERPVPPRVTAHGYLGQEELRRLLASCDVGVIPMQADSWVGVPYKLCDYAQAGLRIVSSLGGESLAAMERARCGVGYRAGDAPSLAAAVRKAMTLDGDASRRMCEREFDARKIYSGYVAAVKKLLPVLLAMVGCSAWAQTNVAVSAAMSNVVEPEAAWASHADYTNNVLRVAQVLPTEWSVTNPRRKVDRLPANMPFHLAVGPEPADRAAAEAALATVTTSMPTHIRSYFARYRLLAPLQQWLIRRAHPSVTNEETYVRAAAHPVAWTAKDFDLSRLAHLAANLTSNTVPVMAVLRPVYEEFTTSPIRRAEPLVDYPDPRPEETYATPFGVTVVLRAPERRRKFRFVASGYPFGGRNVTFKWVPLGISVGGFPCEDWRERPNVSPERGCGEIQLWWNGGSRRDVLVFARYGEGPWGPPSVISFYALPNERRQYDREGRIESIDYLPDPAVLPSLYQNKPWKDAFVMDSLGNVIGFQRTRRGQFRDERFSWTGEFVTETYASDLPKAARKVRYFTRADDPTTLDYEITDETVEYKMGAFEPRNRGEFPPPKKSKRRGR